MEEIQKIKKSITDVRAAMFDLRVKERELTEDLERAYEKEFEKQMSIEKGSFIKTKRGKEYTYDSIKIAFNTPYIIAHPFKKDGQPSKSVINLHPEEFNFKY